MNILTFSERLQASLNEKLSEFNIQQDDLLKVGSSLSTIGETIMRLKEFTISYTFTSQAEEIKFFKEIKPQFLSQFFYAKKVLTIRTADSFKDPKSRQVFYYRQLRNMEGYVMKNKQFYEYCLTGGTYMDIQYFTLSQQNQKRFDQDAKFSTGYDTKLAKILSIEQLKKYMLTTLHHSDSNQLEGISWTGSKTDLIELIYALESVKVFNSGSADLKKIASAFERLFDINLGNYYRVFQDIRMRKKGQTVFLDELKGSLCKKIEEMN